MVNYTISLIRTLRLMISCRGHNHDLSILGAITASFMHRLLIELTGVLADYNTSRVTSISKVHSVVFLINPDKCASAELTVEPCLLFELVLDIDEARDQCSADPLVVTLGIGCS